MISPELIGTCKVVEILKISIATFRDYRKRGLLVLAEKRGNADLYDKADVVRRGMVIREKRRQGFSLFQISQMRSKEQSNAIVVSNPQEPQAEMSSTELLHGFLIELYLKAGPETKTHIDALCRKWNIRIES